jgi:predicted nuclease of predicted toxin-antitoxin system
VAAQSKAEVFSVFEDARGMDDDDMILKALEENWILITNDKDFGEKVYRDGRFHRGVILLRLEDERSPSKIQVLSRLLRTYPDRSNTFVLPIGRLKGDVPTQSVHQTGKALPFFTLTSFCVKHRIFELPYSFSGW